jgi:hypothetical protein
MKTPIVPERHGIEAFHYQQLPWMLLEKLKSTTPGQALYFYPLYVIFVVLGISQLDNTNQTIVDSIRCELSSLLGIQ